MKKLLVLVVMLVVFATLVSCRLDNRIQVGILQYLEHNALSEARKGFIKGLEDEGFVDGENIKITLLNPETDAPTMAIQAKQLVRKSDLILGIATPAAIAILNEVKSQKKDTPVLFTAVTDPFEANLLPNDNVTGTNDMNPIEEQISLVKELLPNAKKLGILYTASEKNSELQANIAKSEAEKLGLEVIIKTIESVNDLQQVATQLAKDVDVIYIPTDNVVAGAMGIVTQVLETNKIPAIVGEENLLYSGGSLTYSVDYYRLGYETAKMAVKILRDNVSPKDIPSTGLSEYKLIINKKQLDEMGITIPASLLDRADKVVE